MLEVTRKDDESAENLVRRFNKKVIQSGILATARKKKIFRKAYKQDRSQSRSYS